MASVKVIERLRAGGHDALLVGGCVRDLLLEREPEDFDVATNARPEQVAALFEKSVLVGAAFGVVLVVTETSDVEVATFREESGYSDRRRPDTVVFSDAEHDARRRDFTINGLFLDPGAGTLVDYVGGIADLESGVLRCIGKPADRFNEDALRLLRAVRFASSLGFSIDPVTWDALRKCRELIREISAERILDELTKGLTRRNPDLFLQLLSDSRLLEIILPEVHAMHGVEQPPQFHPEGDVFVHTKLVLSKLPENPSPALAFAALLHDVGKPPTATFTDRIRFNYHHKVGAAMTEEIGRRLMMSNDLREQIVSMVYRHMHFVSYPDMKESTARRFLASEIIDDELALHRADCLGSFGSLDTWEMAKARLEELRAEQPAAALPPPLINGEDLISVGMTPGPMFKMVLAEVHDAQMEGRVSTREEAMKLAWELAKEHEKGKSSIAVKERKDPKE